VPLGELGKKPGPPRFQGYLRFNRITFPRHGDGCRRKGQDMTAHAMTAKRGGSRPTIHATVLAPMSLEGQ